MEDFFLQWSFKGGRKYGKLIDEEGKYYIGQFENDIFHGKGKCYSKDGKMHYDGDFYKGKIEGFGKMFGNDGGYYIGELKNGIWNDKGKLYDKNVNLIYEGEFINGEYNK